MQNLREQRSCTVVPECISAQKSTMQMSAEATHSKVAANGEVQVQCAPLHDILARYTNGTRQHVDLWILDVEGHEMTVLAGTDFNKTQVDVMVIEDMWLPPFPRVLDMELGMKGFIKFQQLAIDSVFVRRSSTTVLQSLAPTWFPPSFQADMQFYITRAQDPGQQAALKKSWGLP
jgi:hypothetical protein